MLVKEPSTTAADFNMATGERSLFFKFDSGPVKVYTPKTQSEPMKFTRQIKFNLVFYR